MSGIGTQDAHVIFYEAVTLVIVPTGKYGRVVVPTDRDTDLSITDIVTTTTAAIAAAK